MVWDNKPLKRINSKVFSVYRNLEIGFEHQKTISSGILMKFKSFVKNVNARDCLKRTRSKLIKEQKNSVVDADIKPIPKKALKKKKAVSTKKKHHESDSDSEPEPVSDTEELSD